MEPVNHLFIIGAPKAGTTSLFNWIGSSGRVDPSNIKEPAFFSNDRQFSRGLDWYSTACFLATGSRCKYRLEATPWYLYSSKAVSRIAEYSQDVGLNPKFVICVRDPVRRSTSMYWDQVRTGRELRSLEQAMTADMELSLEAFPRHDVHSAESTTAYVRTSAYSYFLRRWLNMFPSTQFLMIDTGELNSNLTGIRSRLETFLGIADLPQHPPHDNVGGTPRSKTAGRLLTHMEDHAPEWAKRNLRTVVDDARIARWVGGLRQLNVRRDSPREAPVHIARGVQEYLLQCDREFGTVFELLSPQTEGPS